MMRKLSYFKAFVLAAATLGLGTTAWAGDEKPAGETAKPAAAAPAKKMTCKKCKGAFESKKDMVGHAIKDHKAMGCADCAKIFRNKKQATKHAVGAHGKKLCKACGTLFDSDKEKVEDAIKNHGKKGCVACAKLFKNAAQASEHEKMHAGKSE